MRLFPAPASRLALAFPMEVGIWNFYLNPEGEWSNRGRTDADLILARGNI
jgi:hypothetical protein